MIPIHNVMGVGEKMMLEIEKFKTEDRWDGFEV